MAITPYLLYENVSDALKFLSNAPGKRERLSWRSPRIRSMVTVATARRIRKAISGTLLRRSRSAHLRNALLDDRADEFASRRMNRSMCLQAKIGSDLKAERSP